MTIHELKIRPGYYDAVVYGIKTFEVRMDDRGFKVGDSLHLREVEGMSEDGVPDYSGRSCDAVVTYVLRSEEVPGMISEGCCILGIRIVGRARRWTTPTGMRS